MRLRRAAATLLILGLAACAGPAPNPLPTQTQAATVGTAAPTLAAAATLAPTTVASPAATATLIQPIVETAYTSLDVPLTQRVDSSQAGLDSSSPNSFVMHTGDFQLELNSGPDAAIRLSRPGSLAALALRPFGRQLNALGKVDQVMAVGEPDRPGILVTGNSAWMQYQLWLWVYPHNPGLLHYHMEVTRSADLPAGSVEPEWLFVDPATGAETAANCVLDATTAANVIECASTLTSCASSVAAPVLTCAQKWTACLAQNLFNFLQCDAQLATCK